MPDHLHIILTPGESTSLEKAVQLLKGGSAREIGKQLAMKFPVWQPGFTEHQIRDEADFHLHISYINGNPVKAKLVRDAREYAHGSATGRFTMDACGSASGAKAPFRAPNDSAGLKPRPSRSHSLEDENA